MTPSADRPDFQIRAAAETDVDAIAEVWHTAPVPTRRYEERLGGS